MSVDDADGDTQDAHGRVRKETVALADLAHAAICMPSEQRVVSCAAALLGEARRCALFALLVMLYHKDR